MGDFFRSAMNYLSQASGNGASAGRTHPLVGTTIKMSGISYRVRSLLAEGGYALVFAVQDAHNNWFALKRQLAMDKSAAEAIIKEISFMKELSGHPCIVRYTQATRQELKDSPGRIEFLLLMELCTGGNLTDLLQKDALMPEQICKIFYATCSAVQHMHDRSPPITHRDIKIENLLFDAKGYIRLCDFGSATMEIFRPDEEWSVSKRNLLEEEMARYTTPMYRAPEILDTYQNYPIGPAQDVWALGCILYYLCYRQHPFEDSAKLRIINANFTLPDADNTPYAMFHSIIRRLYGNSLQPNPYSRPTIGDLCEQVQELANIMQIKLCDPIVAVSNDSSIDSIFINQYNVNSSVHQQNQADQLSGSDVFAQLKGQGLSLFKNIKDKSSAVMQNVQIGTSSLISNYSQGNGGMPVPVRPPPPVPPPPQQQHTARNGNTHRAMVHTIPPTLDFFAEHPQQQPLPRSSIVRGPPPPSPPQIRHDASPQYDSKKAMHLRQHSGSSPPPVPPHQIRNDKHYFAKTHEDADVQSRWDIGLDRQSLNPPTPSVDYNPPNVAEADFLGLGETSKPLDVMVQDTKLKKIDESNIKEPFDPFNVFSNEARPTSTSPTFAKTYGDILGDISENSLPDAGLKCSNITNNNSDDFVLFENVEKKMSSSSMAHSSEVADLLGSAEGMTPIVRNVSTPNFVKPCGNTDISGLEHDFLLLDPSNKNDTFKGSDFTSFDMSAKAAQKKFDPFSEFLATVTDKGFGEQSTASECVAQHPEYNRAYFEKARTTGRVSKPKVPPPASAFDDILSAQGFSASSKQTNRTLADLQREENIKDTDPIVIKIRDWTAGKERNVRALLGSLSDVLWDDAESRWTQPSMAELLSHVQIKKQYRKACLVVHPDKQTGTPHELLAKAIFTELNDAWNTFEASQQT